MECCSTEETPSRDGRSCPVCGEVGRRVQTVTLDALVRDDVPRNDEVYRFCGVSGCEAAWFGEQTGHVIPVRASRVRIGQKESSFDRPLCYCFGYRHSDLVEDLGAHGRSTIPATIAERCRRGEHRCAETNPQGSCCLGNVRAALKRLEG